MKKSYKNVLLPFIISILFFSCIKELSNEKGNPSTSSGTATGTLKDSTGDCLSITPKGSYYIGKAITGDTNYLQVTVNVEATGSYSIQSDKQNGVQFAGTGTFTNTGVQSISLIATGTPLLVKTTTFTIAFQGSSCTADVTIQDTAGSGSGNTAQYTFGGAPNACTNPTIKGNYYAKAALGISNTVAISVNVTKAGTYSITTSTINGYKFSGSGTFTSTGAQTITLTGSGTPALAETDVFGLSGSGSLCSFNIPVTTAPVAVFTLSGAPNACTNFVVAGTYGIGTQLTTGNTVVLNVNVTSLGTYTVSSNLQNGFSFSTSGTFTTTGPQSITLSGSGTPIDSVLTAFTVTVGASTCSFSINVVAAAPPCSSLPANQFTMYNSDGTLRYNIASSGNAIIINNYEVQVTDGSTASLIIDFLGTNTPTPGTYTVGVNVTVKSPDISFISNAITWNAKNGNKLYVSTDPVTGGIIIQFCNVNFSATSILNPGNVYSAVGQANIQVF
jgi:hypothetical protein